VIDNTRELRDVLLERGFKKEKNLFYREVKGAGHNEYSWSQRIDKVLAALYPS